MNPNGFPKKQFLILSAVCAGLVVLALVIGLMTKNGGSNSPSYVIEETPVRTK